MRMVWPLYVREHLTRGHPLIRVWVFVIRMLKPISMNQKSSTRLFAPDYFGFRSQHDVQCAPIKVIHCLWNCVKTV